MGEHPRRWKVVGSNPAVFAKVRLFDIHENLAGLCARFLNRESKMEIFKLEKAISDYSDTLIKVLPSYSRSKHLYARKLRAAARLKKRRGIVLDMPKKPKR